MPVVAIVVVLAIGFWLWRSGVFAPHGKNCRWVPTGNDTISLGEYRCKTCKVTAYAAGGKTPVECKRSLRGGL